MCSPWDINLPHRLLEPSMRLLDQVEAVAKALDEAGVHTGQGTNNTWDEAAWLVLWALGWPLDTPLDPPQESDPEDSSALALATLNSTQLEAIESAKHQRIAKRIPMAYIAREAWLQGHSFYVDERVIIPRSLIAEVLTSGSLSHWMPHPPKRILDLCTGNGSLGILSALQWPESFVVGSDVSEQALEVARINALRHEAQSRTQWLLSDGLNALITPGPHQTQAPFDLILCNPPYVPIPSMKVLPEEFKAEPTLALVGGQDGMDFIQAVLPSLHHLMTPSALLVLEIGHEIEAFGKRFPGLPFVSLSTQESDDQVLLLMENELKTYFA